MPRKIRLPGDPARNRQSQQRSRARRKEYVEELEARVRDYERRDAEATRDMQRAARAACWENGRLLALLALHGVSRAAVDAFLAQEAAGPVGNGNANGHSPSANAGLVIAPVERFGVPHTTDMSSSTQSRADQSLRSRSGLLAAPGAEHADGNLLSTSRCERDVRKACPPSDAEIAFPEDETEIPPTHATPCDAAASIIAELQGHGDTAEARGLLGCKDSSNCHVKNTRLFQLMVETT
ncbi:hypothetical protein SLS62_007243 [Diatrype stigma]|uniref:BZIP domain-containing protein n=1 Tax=Diatrype stigma TaxID=117547 RepID=A0AAN9YQZ0_9PEZI